MEISTKKYCNSCFEYSRFETREVKIGDVVLGGQQPIRVQSMTTVDTMDTEGSVEQSIRMIEAGCELVRITAPSKRDAENLQSIKDALKKRGYTTPLVADIHFTPNAAEIAAKIVEKVRVNPGNYADKKKFEHIEYTDESYQNELKRIRDKFTPLVKLCKENGTAMRIGTNHGSLSDRIMSRFGDTPEGMVESALEFVRVCREHDYHDIVLSMKASNPQIMVQAYRLLVHQMMEEGMNYPLHLGVTEAGDGEDGRVKSALGIGTLLEDGLGDTVRVSLTEEPEHEIPVAQALIDRYKSRNGQKIPAPETNPLNPFSYEQRDSKKVVNIGDKEVPRIVIDYSHKEKITPANLFGVGYQYAADLDKWNVNDNACDYIYTGPSVPDFEWPGTLGVIVDAEKWKENAGKERLYPLFSLSNYSKAEQKHPELNFVTASLQDILQPGLHSIINDDTVVLVITTNNEHGMAEHRRIFMELINQHCNVPVIIKNSYSTLNEDQYQLYAATDFGALLIDGLGNGVWSEAPSNSPALINRVAFNILQATRMRISKTEYISCPSCGRTLFDLQETTAKIRNRTSHLKGVKIGIMGCIVNGPGEMADADYGYVGTGPGKITLYKEKEVVKRNVPEENAVDELIELIDSYGDWVEPA